MPDGLFPGGSHQTLEVKKEKQMKIIYNALAILTLLSTGCVNVSKEAKFNDPRSIDSTYCGTKRIDIFESLIEQSFAYCNSTYFESMIYSGQLHELADGQVKVGLKTPSSSEIKFDSISFTKAISPNYSFPYVQKNIEILGMIQATENHDQTTWTTGWPIAEIDGSIFIVQPIYTE